MKGYGLHGNITLHFGCDDFVFHLHFRAACSALHFCPRIRENVKNTGIYGTENVKITAVYCGENVKKEVSYYAENVKFVIFADVSKRLEI